MNYEVNKQGHLMIGGVSAVDLAAQYGTPLYVMDEQKIRSSMREFALSLKEGYNGHGLACFASKAFSCKEIYRIAKSEGLGADVVSQGELFTALKSGFDMSKVCLHGNNKSRADLIFAIENNVGRIIVDNLDELNRLSGVCAGLNKTAKIMLRIKPGVSAHTHDFIRTGQIDSKFGLALETGEALAAVKLALKTSRIELTGVHCHIGSQILSTNGFVLAAEVMMGFLAKIKEETGVTLTELNLGGGFGVPYTSKDTPLLIKDCLYQMFGTIRIAAQKHNMPCPFLFLEPGRSIVAPAGTTLYTVGSLKHIPNVRTYLSVDGGMCDNMRYILYQAEYEMTLANKASMPKNAVYTIAGKCCESGDLIGENIALQQAQPDDILAVFCTGAYNFSMYSTYNRNLRPPVVMVNNGASRIIVKAQTLESISSDDV